MSFIAFRALPQIPKLPVNRAFEECIEEMHDILQTVIYVAVDSVDSETVTVFDTDVPDTAWASPAVVQDERFDAKDVYNMVAVFSRHVLKIYNVLKKDNCPDSGIIALPFTQTHDVLCEVLGMCVRDGCWTEDAIWKVLEYVDNKGGLMC